MMFNLEKKFTDSVERKGLTWRGNRITPVYYLDLVHASRNENTPWNKGTMARICNVSGTMAVAAPRVIIPARCHGRLKKPLECNQPHSSCHSLLASLEGALGERVPCLQGVLTRRNIAIPSLRSIQWMESASRCYTPVKPVNEPALIVPPSLGETIIKEARSRVRRVRNFETLVRSFVCSRQ